MPVRPSRRPYAVGLAALPPPELLVAEARVVSHDDWTAVLCGVFGVAIIIVALAR